MRHKVYLITHTSTSFSEHLDRNEGVGLTRQGYIEDKWLMADLRQRSNSIAYFSRFWLSFVLPYTVCVPCVLESSLQTRMCGSVFGGVVSLHTLTIRRIGLDHASFQQSRDGFKRIHGTDLPFALFPSRGGANNLVMFRLSFECTITEARSEIEQGSSRHSRETRKKD